MGIVCPARRHDAEAGERCRLVSCPRLPYGGEVLPKAAIKIVGGEQYILSAVMHADERNRAMSDALGQDVYHYHLHVVYIPVVEKQILWTKRCKDKSLVGRSRKRYSRSA